MTEQFLYLTTTGRVTGNPHTIEIWYVDYANCYYLCSEYPEKSDWVRNVKRKPSVSYYIAEQDQTMPTQAGQASIVDDINLIEILREKFESKYNWNNGTFVEIRPID